MLKLWAECAKKPLRERRFMSSGNGNRRCRYCLAHAERYEGALA